jgi:NAD(P)-dependent dehydrogenase (short-subunit alcohol dehydrogenase family)
VAIYAPFEQPSIDDMDRVFQVNLFSRWDLCRQAIGGMRDRGHGWIVNIGSFAAVHPSGPPFMDTNPGMRGSAYGSSKPAHARLTAAIAAESYQDGVAANVLAPNASVRVREDWPYPDEITEPVGTMAEAALALATCSPAECTWKVHDSLSLIVELALPVRTLDGASALSGWQPSEISPARLRQP